MKLGHCTECLLIHGFVFGCPLVAHLFYGYLSYMHEMYMTFVRAEVAIDICWTSTGRDTKGMTT
jgi:hypothetical protein